MDEKKTHLQFYYRTQDAWDAMFQDCLNANESIEFEQYILQEDDAGKRFLELFAEKSRQGVRIRLLIDSIGSMGLESSPLIKSIHDAGGEVRFYNPVGWLNLFVPSSWCPRNHTKTMLIDSKIGYIGSVCLAQEMEDWQDLHVRFEGGLARDVQDAFESPVRMRRINPQAADRQRNFRYTHSYPHLGRNPLYKEMVAEIRAAKKSVCIVSPYFVPPWKLRHALYHAAARGVDVRIMISNKTDVRLADFVTRSYFERLLEKGIRLFLYKPGMLHAKYVIIDDTWATVGSSNMDYLSLLQNREANIVIKDGETISALRDHFDSDLEKCREVGAEYCKHIPLYQRIAGWLARPIRRIL